jgi:hypothetical protein
MLAGHCWMWWLATVWMCGCPDDYLNVYEAQCSVAKLEWKPRRRSGELSIHRAYVRGTPLEPTAGTREYRAFQVNEAGAGRRERRNRRAREPRETARRAWIGVSRDATALLARWSGYGANVPSNHATRAPSPPLIPISRNSSLRAAERSA